MAFCFFIVKMRIKSEYPKKSCIVTSRFRKNLVKGDQPKVTLASAFFLCFHFDQVPNGLAWSRGLTH